MVKKIVYSSSAPEPIGPYSQAVVAGGFIFVSGQIPIDPATGSVNRGTIGEQTRLIFDNITNILGEAGADIENIIKLSIFLKDLDDFSAVNEVCAEIFSDKPPARETIGVVALPKGVDIELSVIAFINGD